MSVFKHVSMYSGVMGSIMKDIRCSGAGLAGKFELFNMDVIFFIMSPIFINTYVVNVTLQGMKLGFFIKPTIGQLMMVALI